jgi:ribosomal-protein-alanine N-acetyltransferase
MLDLALAFMTFPLLETERVMLRPITLDDVDAIFRVMSDPQVIRYFGQLPMGSRTEAVQWVESIQAAFQERRGIRWAITHRDTAEFLGSCGFWWIEHVHERAEIRV